MKVPYILALLLVGLIAFGIYGYRQAATQPNTVTLHPAPGNQMVQMFTTLNENAEVLAVYPDGYECTYVSGPTSTVELGISMSFYQLTCGTHTGYVNAKRVR